MANLEQLLLEKLLKDPASLQESVLVKFAGVEVKFSGFDAGVSTPIDLFTQGFEALKEFLTFNKYRHPAGVQVIFEEDKPVLALVVGMREINWQEDGIIYSPEKKISYVNLISVRPDVGNITVGRGHHPYEHRSGRGVELDNFMPQSRFPGRVTISKENAGYHIELARDAIAD